MLVDIETLKSKLVLCVKATQFGKSAVFQARIVIAVKVVDSENAVACRNKFFCDVKSTKPATPVTR